MHIHIDMDYFFAQIEEQRKPEIRGKIVVVCVFSGRTEDSGVVSTVNYPGRAIGIHSGIPIVFAKKIIAKMNADAVLLPMDREEYEKVSVEIDRIIRNECDRVVRASIDEWNLEVSCGLNECKKIGEKLKKMIKFEVGLSCSIGIAPSVLGAKMVAGLNKPDGFSILDQGQEREFIDNSEVEKVPGIGRKTGDALAALGVKKVNDIKKIDNMKLSEIFGRKAGGWLWNLGNGNYIDNIGEEREQEGISRIGTLKEKTRDETEISNKLKELESEAKQWLSINKKSYKTISIIFITDNLKTHTKSKSFRNPKTWREPLELKELIAEFLIENGQEIRRVGIRFGNLLDMGGQTTLF